MTATEVVQKMDENLNTVFSTTLDEASLCVDERRTYATFAESLFHATNGMWGTMLAPIDGLRMEEALRALGSNAAARAINAQRLLLRLFTAVHNATLEQDPGYMSQLLVLVCLSETDKTVTSDYSFFAGSGLWPSGLTQVLAFYFFALGGDRVMLWTETLQGIIGMTNPEQFNAEDINATMDDITDVMDVIRNFNDKAVFAALKNDNPAAVVAALGALVDDIPEIEMPDFGWLYADAAYDSQASDDEDAADDNHDL